jgi:hypothetical protein
MEKAALVETLVMSEKNNSVVRIKIFNTDKPVIGAVQKVLNQIIILKSVAAEPITLTFADIESVNQPPPTSIGRLLRNFEETLHKHFSKELNRGIRFLFALCLKGRIRG